MDVIGQLDDARQDPRNARQKDLDEKNAADAWMAIDASAEDRLIAFDRWLRARLEKRLNWAWAGTLKAKRIEQCRLRVEAMVLQLWKRGWLLDGTRLAKHVNDLLTAVATYQEKGQVRDFWAYFNAACERYVGQNAEEIQAEAMRAGALASTVLATLLQRSSKRPETPLPDLLAQRADEVTKANDLTLREKTARARARASADASQGQLFNQ